MIYQVTENVTKSFFRDIDDDGRSRDIELSHIEVQSIEQLNYIRTEVI